MASEELHARRRAGSPTGNSQDWTDGEDVDELCHRSLKCLAAIAYNAKADQASAKWPESDVSGTRVPFGGPLLYDIAAGGLRPVRGSQLLVVAQHYGAGEPIEPRPHRCKPRYPPYGAHIGVRRLPGTNVREQLNQRARDRWWPLVDNLVKSVRWATAHNYNLAQT
jgi:hypothetical protein